MEPDPDHEAWEAYAVPPGERRGWMELGFGAFAAGLARADGFTPRSAGHYRRQLRKTADSWKRVGMGDPEGLEWHLAGFAAKDAIQWRSDGVDVEAARVRRDGYHHDPTQR